MWKGTGRKQKKGAESCQEMMEPDRPVKGRQQVEAQGLVAQERRKEHAAGLVKAKGKEWVAAKAGAVVPLEGQRSARAVAAAGAVADVEFNE